MRDPTHERLAAPQRHQPVLTSPHYERRLRHALDGLRLGAQDAGERTRNGTREIGEIGCRQPLLQDAPARDVADPRAVVEVLLEETFEARTQDARAGERLERLTDRPHR